MGLRRYWSRGVGIEASAAVLEWRRYWSGGGIGMASAVLERIEVPSQRLQSAPICPPRSLHGTAARPSPGNPQLMGSLPLSPVPNKGHHTGRFVVDRR
jgi:hypothetical protein